MTPASIRGLLHVTTDATAPVNLRARRDPLEIHIRCAASCAAHGYQFRLFTNEVPLLDRRVAELGLSGLRTVPHTFQVDVPAGIGFRSAQYKLDLLKAFGQGRFGIRMALVDLDVVLLCSLPNTARRTRARRLRRFRDRGARLRDRRGRRYVSQSRGTGPSAALVGGKFLLGDPSSLDDLSCYIDTLWPAYAAPWGTLYQKAMRCC